MQNSVVTGQSDRQIDSVHADQKGTEYIPVGRKMIGWRVQMEWVQIEGQSSFLFHTCSQG